MQILAAAKLNGFEPDIAICQLHVTNKSPEFLAKFPAGKLPVFEEPNGFCLAEYVSQPGPRAGQLLGRNHLSLAEIRQWRIRVATFDRTTEFKALASLEYGLTVLVKHLTTRTFLVGDALTLADLTGASSLLWAFMHVVDERWRKQFPDVVRWYLKSIDNEEVADVFEVPDMIEKRNDGPE